MRVANVAIKSRKKISCRYLGVPFHSIAYLLAGDIHRQQEEAIKKEIKEEQIKYDELIKKQRNTEQQKYEELLNLYR